MKLHGHLRFLFILCFSPLCLAQQETEISADDQAYIEWAQDLWSSIDQQTGTIELTGNVATLEVPESFFYINAADSNKVLTEVWGNPPSVANGVLGMLFPTNSTPFDGNSWGVTIEYVEEGYINDEDAENIDYADMLSQMKKDTLDSNEERIAQGYQSIELVGWAAPPFYDHDAKKLHWAKEIKFENNDLNTLNYNIRILGRKGMLVLNFIAGIDQLDEINGELDQVLSIAEFNAGHRYSDFNPDIDEVAAYGIGALIAGKVAAKAGFFAAALVFLKKFGVFIVVGIGAFIKKVFSRKKATSD